MAQDKRGTINPFEFDSRMVEWNLKHNAITKEQLQTYLKSLPDSSANAVTVELDERGMSNGGYHGDSFPTQA